MMLKRNEGYALSYVLVVLLVLCIIAISVMSAPLRNLQMQQASIARMQDKYAAQGMIEQVVAQLKTTPNLDNLSYPPGCEKTESDGATLSIKATSNNTSYEVKLTLTAIPDSEGTPTGYTYEYENISYNTGGGA